MIQQLNARGNDLLTRLESASDDTARALATASDETARALANASDNSARAISTASDETARAIAVASEQLTGSLNFKTDHIGDEFNEIARGLEDMMTERLDRVTEGFSEKSLAILDLMVGALAGPHRHWSPAGRRS